MFISSSIFSGLEFWSVNRTSIYENSELRIFKNIKLLGEISNNWPNDSLGTKCIQDSWVLLIIVVNNITMD